MYRVGHISEVLSDALTEGSACLPDITLAAGGTFDDVNDG